MKGNLLFEHCVIVKLTHLAEQHVLFLELWQFREVASSWKGWCFTVEVQNDLTAEAPKSDCRELNSVLGFFFVTYLYSCLIHLPFHFPLCRRGVVTFSSPQHFAFLEFKFFREWYIIVTWEIREQEFILRKFLEKKKPLSIMFSSPIYLCVSPRD